MPVVEDSDTDESGKEEQMGMVCGIYRRHGRGRGSCSPGTTWNIGSLVTENGEGLRSILPRPITKILILRHQVPNDHLFTSIFI